MVLAKRLFYNHIIDISYLFYEVFHTLNLSYIHSLVHEGTFDNFIFMYYIREHPFFPTDFKCHCTIEQGSIGQLFMGGGLKFANIQVIVDLVDFSASNIWILSRKNGSMCHLHFKTAFEKIGPSMLFHWYKHLYHTITNPCMSCTRVVHSAWWYSAQIVKGTAGGLDSVQKLAFRPPLVALRGLPMDSKMTRSHTLSKWISVWKWKFHSKCVAITEKKDGAKTVPFGHRFEKWCPFQ